MLIVARGLRVGQDVTDMEIDALQEDEAAERAYASALNFLSYRPRSAREIRDHLRRKKIEDGLVTAVIERLQRSGLLDDSQFARYWVENRQTFRPRGRRALHAEMRQKGLADDTIEEALEGLGDEESTAYDVAVSKARSYAHEDEPAFFRKMTSYLQRRGFPFDTSARATRRAWQHTNGTPGSASEE